MSTKTTLKRIALVAVSALGLGLFSTGTTANAAEPATWSIGTATSNVAVVGQVSVISVPVSITANTSTDDTLTVAVVPQAWPATSGVNAAANVDRTTSTFSTADSTYGTVTGTWDSASASYNYSMLTLSGDLATGYTLSSTANFVFTPDVAGSYTFAYFKDTDSDGVLDSGETVKYLTVTATSAPAATVVMSQQLAGTGSTSAGGLYVRINAADSAGALTRLASSQLLMVTVPSGLTLAAKHDGTTETSLTGITATDYGLSTGDFNSSGYAWLKFTSTTAGTKAVTAKISNGTDVATLGLVYAATAGTATVCGTVGTAGNADGTDVPASSRALVTGYASSVSLGYIASTDTSSTVTVCSATDDAVLPVAIEDTDKSIFGSAAAITQTIAVTVGEAADTAAATDGTAGKAVGSFAVAHGALGNKTNTATKKTYTVTAGSVAAFTVQGQTSAASSGDTTITPATSVKVVNGGSITFTAAFTDQFGNAKSGLPITAQVTAGRNLQATATNLVSDAAGEVTFTVTDAAPTSTTTTSTVTFGGGASGSATITWVSALSATTMTTSPSAVSNDTADKAFDAGAVSVSGTASAGADSVSATVKDENGVAIAGLPVTITLPADVTLKSTSTATAYTNSSGVASWSIYTTKAGTYALSFDGGGLTKTSYIKWTGGSQRNITATAGTTSGDVTPVTIAVKDAHGNPVPNLTGVSLTATDGYFQGIPMTSSQSTDANGLITVAFVGSGTVTAKVTGGQTLDLAGYVGTTAATGFPAGNQTATLTITGGANASQAAAEAATDAAAEAIDAANAATDAANLAAEAADAATVAAEEARDAADAATAAVEELATQVATLMAALKAQITTLANTVAKIAKKVKA